MSKSFIPPGLLCLDRLLSSHQTETNHTSSSVPGNQINPCWLTPRDSQALYLSVHRANAEVPTQTTAIVCAGMPTKC